MEFLRRGFKTIGFRGDYDIGLMDEHHILIRFQLNEDYQRCWLHQIWKFKTYTMWILKWTPFFHKDEEPPISPIWVSFENLPLFMFKGEALFSAGQIIGKPLKMDTATATLSRPSVARLCVEVDLLKPLPRRFWIGQGANGFWQSINYEAIPKYCFGCRRFGHLEENCGHKETAPLITQAWREKNPTTRLESAAGIDKELSELNPSVVQLENGISLQNNKLDLDLVSAVKPVVEGGLMSSNAANPSDGNHSSQSARRNDAQAGALATENAVGAEAPTAIVLLQQIVPGVITSPPDVNPKDVGAAAISNISPEIHLDMTKRISPEMPLAEYTGTEDVCQKSNEKSSTSDSHCSGAKLQSVNKVMDPISSALDICSSVLENFQVQHVESTPVENINDRNQQVENIQVQVSAIEKQSHTLMQLQKEATLQIEEDLTDQAAETHPNHSPTVDDEIEKENPSTEVRSTAEPKQKTVALNPNPIEFHLPNVIEKESSPTNAAISEKPRMEDQTSSPTLVVDFSHHNLVNLTSDIITQEQIAAFSEEIHKVVYHKSYDTQYEHEIEDEEEEWLEEDEEEYWENEDIRDKFFRRRRGRSPASRRKNSFVPHAMRRRSSKSLD